MASVPTFGEYITNEYGLLKQILSYLKPCDLWNAKLVCQEWNRTVESLVDKNPVMIVCEMTEQSTPYFETHKPVLPTLVIHQASKKKQGENQIYSACETCKMHFILDFCPCTLIGPETTYVSISSFPWQGPLVLARDGLPYITSCYNFRKHFMGFLLPASEHLQVSVFTAEPKHPFFNEPITDDIVDQCLGGREPVKCILVLRRSAGTHPIGWINRLVAQVISRQGMTFAIGGGDAHQMKCKTKAKPTWSKCDLILVALRGDMLTAHSDILEGVVEPEIQRFMDQFAERVGPVPQDSTRMALIAQCVDRTDDCVESMECRNFKRCFPSVPAFGLQVFGEYGIKRFNKASRKNKAKKMKTFTTFEHSGTSSFLILTFKNT